MERDRNLVASLERAPSRSAVQRPYRIDGVVFVSRPGPHGNDGHGATTSVGELSAGDGRQGPENRKKFEEGGMNLIAVHQTHARYFGQRDPCTDSVGRAGAADWRARESFRAGSTRPEGGLRISDESSVRRLGRL